DHFARLRVPSLSCLLLFYYKITQPGYLDIFTLSQTLFHDLKELLDEIRRFSLRKTEFFVYHRHYFLLRHTSSLRSQFYPFFHGKPVDDDLLQSVYVLVRESVLVG